MLSKCPFSFLCQNNQTNLTVLFYNRCFIIPLHSDCLLKNIKVVFLLWNLVKQCKLALTKSHNLPHNSPILSHDLPWKYRTMSDFLSHSIRWPESYMTPLHCWPHCLSLKSKWLPRYRDQRFQMSCKAFVSGKSPKIIFRLENVLLKLEFITY